MVRIMYISIKNVLTLSDLFGSNKLILNSPKTANLCFRTSNNVPGPNHLMLNNQRFNVVSTTRFFGYLRCRFNQIVNTHWPFLSKVFSSWCYALHNLKKIFDISTVKIIYYDTVYIKMKYGILFWGQIISGSKERNEDYAGSEYHCQF